MGDFVIAYRTVASGTTIPATFGGVEFTFTRTFTATPFVSHSLRGDVDNPVSFNAMNNIVVTCNSAKTGWQVRAKDNPIILAQELVLVVIGFETW